MVPSVATKHNTCAKCFGGCIDRIGYDEKIEPVYGCYTCKPVIISALHEMVRSGKTFLVCLYNAGEMGAATKK